MFVISSPDDVIRKYFDSVSSLTVSFHRASGAKIMAFITCELCNKFAQSKSTQTKKIKLVRGPQQSWPVYNLANHFNAHRSNRNNNSTKRYQKISVIPDTWHNVPHRISESTAVSVISFHEEQSLNLHDDSDSTCKDAYCDVNPTSDEVISYCEELTQDSFDSDLPEVYHDEHAAGIVEASVDDIAHHAEIDADELAESETIFSDDGR